MLLRGCKMPKIKGWNKVGENTWYHKKTDVYVGIEKGFGGYQAYIRFNSSPKAEHYGVADGEILTNKSDVRELLIDWMKRNSFGVEG